MSIAAIIEKYTVIRSVYTNLGPMTLTEIQGIYFPALTAELETLMREEACRFAEWADDNGFTKVPKGWITPGGIWIPVNDIYDQFKNQDKPKQ